jgi:hypothetical protein
MRNLPIVRTLVPVAFVLTTALPVLAGPPLVCFPFDIGTAASLPWDAQGHAWKGMRADYDVTNLTKETVRLLAPATPVIVRMETLRRAALYATKNQHVAGALLETLLNRAKTAPEDPLATFDAGYLAETYKQLQPIAPFTAALAASVDGYALVNKSLTARPRDPALEFAAAVITMDGRRGAYDEHVRIARAGAAGDQLLARNVGQLER